MNNQDRMLLKSTYGLTYKESSKVFSMVRNGSFTIDSAAKFVIKDRSLCAKK